LSPCETYVALIKGYCALGILMFPKAFQNGGYVFSPCVEVISAILTTICVTKLVDCGNKFGIYSYSAVVEKAFGRVARSLCDIMICATQFSFTISHMVYVTESCKSVVDEVFQVESSKVIYAVGIVVILMPIVWTRNIAKLAWTYFFGVLMLMLCYVVVIVFCAKQMTE